MRGSKGMSERAMEKGDAHEPRGGGDAPRQRPYPADAGPERKAEVRAAQDSNPSEHNPLRGAVQELGRQHPIKHDDHGPHHGTDHHIRHMPLHGMKPGTAGR